MFDLSENAFADATIEEVVEMIAELSEYRERFANETLSAAQRAKVMKNQAEAQLQPTLAKIDATLQLLRDRHALLTAQN